MSFKILAESSKDSRIWGHSNTTVSWLKSKKLKVIGPFALQLETKSTQAVSSGDPSCWFEISVYDDNGERPVKTWFSHMNESVSTSPTNVWHFGPIFYPDHELIQSLKVGNIIGVEVGSTSRRKWSVPVEGRLVVKPLANLIPLTEHLPWSLRDSPEEGVYTISTNDECVVTGRGNSPVTKVWFKTPPLSLDILSRLNNVKLVTNARHQGQIPFQRRDISSWFDLVAFENEDEEEEKGPLKDDDGPIVSESHKIAASAGHNERQEGRLFYRGDDFISRLTAGNVIAARVCAQYSGWENHAVYGRLVISLAERQVPPLPPKEEKTKNFTLQLLEMVMSYDKDILKGVLKELEVGVLSKE